MLKRDVFLKKVHINNFLSFNDVELPLKPLTVLVGPNASGKSNVVEVLHLLHWMLLQGTLPTIRIIQHSPPIGAGDRSIFQFQVQVEDSRAVYDLALKAKSDSHLSEVEPPISDEEMIRMHVVSEKLLVDDVDVISLQSGQHILKDENGKHPTRYNPKALALKAAGDYGAKPVTSAVAEFIQRWEFYAFDSKLIRSHSWRRSSSLIRESTLDYFLRPGASRSRDHVRALSAQLLYWHDKDQERFNKVSKSLEACMNFAIEKRPTSGDGRLCLLEGREKSIPFETASEGTLRLVAYYILLYQADLPGLVAVEEPEQNLHPAALSEVARVFEQLAERTQVIITTHSSQLLDTFDPEKLSDSLGILLLRNPQGRGTEVTNLQDLSGNRPALDGWITDFGFGSAIFDSELLSESMKESE